MSSTEDMLHAKLLQLECHFTWGLNDTDLTDLQNRLKDNIELESGEDRNIGWSYGHLAFTKYKQDLLEEAWDDLVKAEEHIRNQHGDNCEKQLIVTYSNFAWLHYHKGEHERSQTYLDKLNGIQESFPTQSPSTLHPETYGEKGRAFLTSSRQYYEKAKECFEKAIELEPDGIDWNVDYAVVLYRTIESSLTSFEESPAYRQLRRVLEIDPNNAYILALLGLKLAYCKEYQKAEEFIERAMNLNPNKPYVIQNVAKFYRLSGKLDKSLSLLKRAVEMTPNSVTLHHQLALIYKNKRIKSNKRREEAETLLKLCIHHLEQAISIKPSFVHAMIELAACYAEGMLLKKAEDMFQETFKVATAKNEHLHVVNLRYADFQLYRMKSEPLAIKHYKEGLKLQKDSAEGKWCAQKLKGIAERHISRGDGKAFGILGFVHEITGEKSQAIEYYEKAILCDPGNEEYLTALCNLRLPQP